MLILGIDTSCDDTSCAVVEDGSHIRSNIISSQFNVHKKYGGVVPELASRKHIENIGYVITEALDSAGTHLKEIDIFAATQGPGLIGALLVGLSCAKSIAYALKKPLSCINHIEGHIYSAFLEYTDIRYPFISLVVSGGHTDLILVSGYGDYIILGRTRDDAAGEAYDKAAKMLGLGYPGGPVIDSLALKGDPEAIRFPRAFLGKDSFDFSFSGLKTSVRNFLQKEETSKKARIEDIAAAFQASVVDVLVEKTVAAVKKFDIERLTISGGVASNSQLRHTITERAKSEGFSVFIPSGELCTDNGAMIACAAYHQAKSGTIPTYSDDILTVDACANMRLDKQ